MLPQAIITNERAKQHRRRRLTLAYFILYFKPIISIARIDFLDR
jgi:hypothetical protein